MSARDSTFKKFEIQSAEDGGKVVDVREGIGAFSYYENVISNFVTSSVSVVESGTRDKSGKVTEGILNYLPVRGGEEVRVVAVDSFKNELKYDTNELYVNTVQVPSESGQSALINFGLVSKEFFSNEKTRVLKRYEGKVSETIKDILTNVLKTTNFKEENIEETSNAYAFIGNDRKPFWTLSWLGTKSIPTTQYGKSAGFVFYQTQDGYNFKSIENLLKGEVKAKFIYKDTVADNEPEVKSILSYTIDKNINVQQDMMLGVYHNRTIYFDPYLFEVDVKTFDITQQEQTNHSGKPSGFNQVNKQFTETPTRLMSTVLDVGTLPIGKSPVEQLEYWNNDKKNTNDKVIERMVQSVMRYNQFLTISTSITIEGDFSLRAGDRVECTFPGRKGAGTKVEVDKVTSGVYTIASLCHHITPERCLTRLGLVRDSFSK